MPQIQTPDGHSIAFDDNGPGHDRPTLLVHGFASNKREGWMRTGWYGAFDQRGQRRIALDLRGHGESDKPHDPARYDRALLCGDLITLLDHLELDRVSLVGFSMGARLALEAVLATPDRFDKLILAGIGGKMLEPSQGASGAMAQAMETDDPEGIQIPMLRSFRMFADQQGEDRLALAACTRAASTPMSADDLLAIRNETLVVAGSRDDLAGSADQLATAIPGARAITLPGCDHFATITHGLFKGAAFDFLDGWTEEI